MSDVWAYVAHKNGYWAGVCSPAVGKRELKEFLAEFAAEGFTLTPVFDRAEYNVLLDTMQEWSHSPEWQHARCRANQPRNLNGNSDDERKGGNNDRVEARIATRRKNR